MTLLNTNLVTSEVTVGWLLFTACTSYEIRMYSYLLILTQCRNCNKDKWQKKYEVDVREGKLEIINFQRA